jgi:hypothetical protein
MGIIVHWDLLCPFTQDSIQNCPAVTTHKLPNLWSRNRGIEVLGIENLGQKYMHDFHEVLGDHGVTFRCTRAGPWILRARVSEKVVEDLLTIFQGLNHAV